MSGAGEKKRLQAALDDAAVHQPGQGFRGKKGGAAGQAAEEVRAKDAQLAAERQKRSETERSALPSELRLRIGARPVGAFER